VCPADIDSVASDEYAIQLGVAEWSQLFVFRRDGSEGWRYLGKYEFADAEPDAAAIGDRVHESRIETRRSVTFRCGLRPRELGLDVTRFPLLDPGEYSGQAPPRGVESGEMARPAEPLAPRFACIFPEIRDFGAEIALGVFDALAPRENVLPWLFDVPSGSFGRDPNYWSLGAIAARSPEKCRLGCVRPMGA
jgi:hypothetical protein